jgi:hypothetical protein
MWSKMDQRGSADKIFESKPLGNRRKGRPKLRWPEDVEEDLWEKKVNFDDINQSTKSEDSQRAVEPRNK